MEQQVDNADLASKKKRNKKNYIIVIGVLIVAAIIGIIFIGKKSNDSGEPKNFKVDTKKLESDGYEKISDIAYIKAYGDDKDTIHIVYLKNEPLDAYFTFYYLMSESIDSSVNEFKKCDMEWNNRRYIFDTEKINKEMEKKIESSKEDDERKQMIITNDIFLSYLPKDWESTVKEFYPVTDTYIGDLAETDTTKAVISNDIDFYFENHAVKKKEESKVDKGSIEENKADENTEIIYNKSENYTVDNEDLTLQLEIKKDKVTDEIKTSFLASGNCKSKENSILLLLSLKTYCDSADFNDFGIILTIKNENLSLSYMNTGKFEQLSGTNSDGSYSVFKPDWYDSTYDIVIKDSQYAPFISEVLTMVEKFTKSIQNDSSKATNK